MARQLQSTATGLDPATAQQRLAGYGPNEIADAKKKTAWQILLHQFTDVMILVLIGAAVISGVIGEAKSTCVILAIVLLNAVVGFIQEYRAEQVMEALQKMTANHADRRGL